MLNIKIKSNFDKNTLQKLKKEVKIRVGIFGDGESATIGAAQEYGTQRAGRGNKVVIPQRSFLREPMFLSQDEIGKNVEHALQAVIFNNVSTQQAMQKVALSMQNISIEALRTSLGGTYVPLAPSTIKRRKKGKDGEPSTRPLIDTGNHILRKITTEVIID